MGKKVPSPGFYGSVSHGQPELEVLILYFRRNVWLKKLFFFPGFCLDREIMKFFLI
jgi:hypothetical protein